MPPLTMDYKVISRFYIRHLQTKKAIEKSIPFKIDVVYGLTLMRQPALKMYIFSLFDAIITPYQCEDFLFTCD